LRSPGSADAGRLKIIEKIIISNSGIRCNFG
jgi:hypothetical protein